MQGRDYWKTYVNATILNRLTGYESEEEQIKQCNPSIAHLHTYSH